MRHNFLDWIQQILSKYRRFIPFGLVVLLVAALGFGIDSLMKMEPKKLVITGLKTIRKEEILSLLSIQKEDKAFVPNNWKELLEKHKRISACAVEVEGDLVRIDVQEKEVMFVIQSAGKLYEVDSALNVISINDVRSDKVLLSGNFAMSNDKVVSPTLKEMIENINKGFESFPALEKRISDCSYLDDGGIECYVQKPNRLRVIMGEELSPLVFRKLYASLAYMEKDRSNVVELDLRGEDAVFH